MVRWKYCLVLALLLLLRTDAKDDDDDEEGDESEEEEEDEDDDDDDDHPEAMEIPGGVRRPKATPMPVASPQMTPTRMERPTKKAPLECYVCGYRSEMPLRSCLDPTKYRVHSVTCHNLDDKCFTTVISKDNTYVAVIRGCRTGCVGSPDTTCCERNRCNNQAFAMPIVPRALTETVDVPDANAATKATPPNVLFFVTVLLLLQTVIKVAFV